MSKLTADEVRVLSRAFRDLSIEIGNYLDRHFLGLSPGSTAKLEELQSTLLTLAQIVGARSLALRLDEADASLKALTRATGGAKRAIRRLDNVREVIKIATGAVRLAGAVMSGDTGAIGKSIKVLVKEATA